MNERTIRGTLAPEAPGEASVGGDHEVTSELARVLGRRSQICQTALRSSQDLRVPTKRRQAPDPADAPAPETVGGIDVTVVVDHDRYGELAALLVRVEQVRRGEREQHEFGVGGESLAHGGDVFGAGQSMDVTVEDQHDRTAAAGADVVVE